MQSFCRFGLPLMLFAWLGVAQAAGSITGPPDQDGPLTVDIGFYLSNINDIDEESETFDFEGILSMHWKDPRLSFDPAETGADELYFQGEYQFNEVFNGWWPQVYLANEAGRYERQGVILKIEPDGSVAYTEEIDAIAKSRLQLRRFPFDEQQFVALFEVLGMDKSRITLHVDADSTGLWQSAHHQVQVPQWRAPVLSTSVVEYDPVYLDGRDTPLTALRVAVEMKRDPGYILRLVVLPVVIFVFLSWSVFWMDRSSLGDRMDISFIGILTVVAYQIMFSENLPKISYATVLMSFMILSFLTMCASVFINLRVAVHDKRGHFEQGDRLDRRCRFLFPLAYVLGSLVIGTWVYNLG